MSKHRLSLKLIAALGVGLLILGFALFLHSLGSGGGLGAMSLMLTGATSLVTAVVIGIVRIFRVKRKPAPE